MRHKTVVVDAAAEPEQTHVVVRQSLHDQLSASFLQTLFSRVDLQEPTFKEIVVIYRTKEQSEEGVRVGAAPRKKKKKWAHCLSSECHSLVKQLCHQAVVYTYISATRNPLDGQATQAHLSQIISRHSTCGL